MNDTMVRERPILFAGPMIRAILGGEKTQTRRAIRAMPDCDLPGAYFDAYRGGPEWCWWTADNRQCNGHGSVTCPYGKPGDRLWVRETWQDGEFARNDPPGTVYRATDSGWGECEGWKWRPSIFMPRWACRIVLEITEVRVQRIRSISEADVKAEGIAEYARPLGLPGTPRDQWAHLWDAINGKRDGGRYAWDHDAWVWAITFRRVESEARP